MYGQRDDSLLHPLRNSILVRLSFRCELHGTLTLLTMKTSSNANSLIKVLDGRSNYLEGALLCASYVIIAVAAFFYPSEAEQSNLGGNAEAASRMVRSIIGA